jgi:hypothetical protein
MQSTSTSTDCVLSCSRSNELFGSALVTWRRAVRQKSIASQRCCHQRQLVQRTASLLFGSIESQATRDAFVSAFQTALVSDILNHPPSGVAEPLQTICSPQTKGGSAHDEHESRRDYSLAHEDSGWLNGWHANLNRVPVFHCGRNKSFQACYNHPWNDCTL